MQAKFFSSAAIVLIGALFVVGEVAATDFPGSGPYPISTVPASESPPLTCNTLTPAGNPGNFTVTAITGSNGEFPKRALCGTPGIACSEYSYQISSPLLNIDHTLFSVSATQELWGGAPTFTPSIAVGDSTTGFLTYARHEYAIRFNSNHSKSDTAQMWISGASRPRVGSVVIRSGSKIVESCVIATPGIAGDTFQPVFQSQTVVLAGGKCTGTLVFDAGGNVINIINPTPVPPNTICNVGSPTGDLMVNDAPLKNNSGPHGITFGTGTTTCYGPPRPSVPLCVCTTVICP